MQRLPTEAAEAGPALATPGTGTAPRTISNAQDGEQALSPGSSGSPPPSSSTATLVAASPMTLGEEWSLLLPPLVATPTLGALPAQVPLHGAAGLAIGGAQHVSAQVGCGGQ